MEIPTEEELRSRITRQLKWRANSDEVVLIWHGYLAGLMEWGIIELETYERLSELLPHKGNKVLAELFQGEPLTAEREREIDEYLKQQGQ
jgi:hypothetical protein